LQGEIEIIISATSDIQVDGDLRRRVARADQMRQPDLLAGRDRVRVDVVAAEPGLDLLEVDLRVVAVLVERALREVHLTGADQRLEHLVGGVAAPDARAGLSLDAGHARLDRGESIQAQQQSIERAGRADEPAEPVELILAERVALTGQHLEFYDLTVVTHDFT
jgi:hypothetical protein